MRGFPLRKFLIVLGVLALALVLVPAASAATITVNTTADTVAVNPAVSCLDSSGNCSLRSAIQRANFLGGDNTIIVPAGTYKLTIAPTGGDGDDSGDLNITDDSGTVTISGAGPASTTVDANFIDRAFRVESGATLQVSGTTIRDGRPGSLGNVSSCPSTAVPEADGGAIFNDGALMLTDDTLTNSMASGAGGAIIDHNGGPISISGTNISANQTCLASSFAPQNGGGIDMLNGGTLSIDSSTISTNTTAGDGGGVATETFFSEFARRSTRQVSTAPVTINNTTISNNNAVSGGGIAGDRGFLVLLVSRRVAPVSTSGMRLFADTISQNHASNNGGGFENGGGASDDIINNTITSNTAGNDGGGVFSGGHETISYSTVTNNSSTGSGTGNLTLTEGFDGSIPSITIDDTIVTGGIGGTNPSNCSGVTSAGHNLFDDVSDNGAQCGASSTTHDVITANPQLGPLAPNGGPTQTQALLPGSPAIDAADDTKCPETVNATDQKVDERGVSRPQGPHCDIGAFERTPATPSADLAISKTPSRHRVRRHQKFSYLLTVTNRGPNTATGVTVTDKLPSNLSLVSVKTQQGTCTGTSTITCTLGTIAIGGHVDITIVVRATHRGRITNTAHVSGSLPDANLNNNTSAATVKRRACRASLHTNYDHDDRVVTVQVFINGNHVSTIHGNFRRVQLGRLLSAGTTHVRLVFTLVDTRQSIVERTYRGCSGGPIHRSSINPESAPSEP